MKHETTTQQCMMLFNHNPKKFLRHYGTVDEAWAYWYTPLPKEQLKQWTSQAKPLQRMQSLSYRPENESLLFFRIYKV